ncbi:cilia- and flagella-associated protein 337-like [Pyxicephalus adspersus]|uniref:EF-hand domain-containing protein n=1 Tax=Pyxicephalus adspersus TaxID=30357 RepID=A0AAV3BA40_PYXAD|nr:TPA: hypothetical protein GDO54_000395 [Pyxicephalus adspersus]
MSQRMKWRPWSALGRLETYHSHSLFSEIRHSSTAAQNQSVQQRAKTAVGTARSQALTPTDFTGESEEERQSPPEWLEKEIIRRHQRRYSLGLVDSVLESLQNQSDPARSLRKEKIEQEVTLEQLQKLKKAFEELEKSGHRSLDLEKFKWAVKKSTGLRGASDEQIEKLFMKIDFTATGKIQWEQFCTYLQLDYSELEESYLRRRKICFQLPATIQETFHGDPILRVFPMQDNTLIMVREDGHIYFWSPQLKLKRDKPIFEKSVKKMAKWVTDFTIMVQYNKLVLATGDREIQLYELSNLEPYCQITRLETMPLKLDYCATDADECMILYGDDKGCVNILLFTSVGETLRTWKKMPKTDNIIPTIVIDNVVLSPHVTYIRWKVHDDWVTQMKYFDSIKAVISSSNDESTALVIGCTIGTTNVEQQMKDIKDHLRDVKGRRAPLTSGPPQKRAAGDQTVFRVYKGVKTFAFCKKNSLVITGGMDRIIRMWNLYVPARATGMLRGHTAPIFFLEVSSEGNKIFSIATDCTIKIWDIQSQTCLFSACSKSTGIRGELSAGLYIPDIKALCVTTDSIAILQVKLKLITGARDGCLKVWNYNNGQCLHTLRRANKCDEICDCTYLEINRNKYIVAVGWDRRISMYIDSDDDLHHFQEPQPGWKDDLIRGHREDILCIAQNPPNLLASSSYDGEIIIWNMISGHIHCRINTALHIDSAGIKLTDKSVSKILFLKTRTVRLQAAGSLVSNGPLGTINFWNLLHGGKLTASFKPSKAGTQISSLAVNKDNTLVFAGDYIGYIYSYDIKDYSIHRLEKDHPPTVCQWRAHVDMITELEVIDEDKVILSSSLDCAVRLWSLNGEFIGTFGQADPWEVFTPTSWKHPMVPYEILIDPQSMPVHPVLEEPADNLEELSTPENEKSKEASDIKQNEAIYILKPVQLNVTEDDIQEEITRKNLNHVHGKWLRHEKYKISHKPLDHGGPTAFHTLQYFELENSLVTVERPNMSAAGMEMFHSYLSS